MRTLIEFYDNNIMTNMIAVLSFQPDKVIYLYDTRFDKKADVHHLFKGCQAHLQDLVMEKYPVGVHNLEEIRRVLNKVVEENEECYINLTGGSGLMLVAGYQVGVEKGLPLLHVDLQKMQLLDVDSDNVVSPVARVGLDDYIFVSGAYLMGYSRHSPGENQYDSILGMCRYIFTHVNDWKNTCLYLQAGMSKRQGLHFQSSRDMVNKNEQLLHANKRFLMEFSKFGFIRDLRVNGSKCEFQFTSAEAKKLMLTYGLWLEMYVYIQASLTPIFSDVRCGVTLDWNAYDGVEILGNEIDVVLMKGSVPIFISCKFTEPDADAINELMVIRSRLGGVYGQGVLVTFADTKKLNTPMNRRAKELGIFVLDKTDILAADFRNRMRNLIMEAVPFD